MHALLFVIVALVLYYLSYHFYATFLSEKIWKLDPNRQTPAYKYEDDFEFVPNTQCCFPCSYLALFGIKSTLVTMQGIV